MTTARPTVLVFARVPERGQVKTRLARTLGDDKALEIYRELAAVVVKSLKAAAGVDLVVCGATEGSAAVLREWLGVTEVWEQGGGDLGARMSRTMQRAFDRGVGAVLLVGTDCPDVSEGVINAAVALLATHDVVFGPATDGGYYLVGARRPVPEVFDGVPWSAPDTLAVSLTKAARSGLSVGQLAMLDDIDTEDDWRRWEARRRGA
jgi:hypothetical protein